jgi:hypothetical protein
MVVVIEWGQFTNYWAVPFYAIGSLLIAYGAALLFVSLFFKNK